MVLVHLFKTQLFRHEFACQAGLDRFMDLMWPTSRHFKESSGEDFIWCFK